MIREMALCAVCGNEFDPIAYQIVLPDRLESFDRIECALVARERPTPTARTERKENTAEILLLRPERGRRMPGKPGESQE